MGFNKPTFRSPPPPWGSPRSKRLTRGHRKAKRRGKTFRRTARTISFGRGGTVDRHRNNTAIVVTCNLLNLEVPSRAQVFQNPCFSRNKQLISAFVFGYGPLAVLHAPAVLRRENGIVPNAMSRERLLRRCGK